MTALVRFKSLVLDVEDRPLPDADRLGAFWAQVGGGRLERSAEGEVADVIGRAEHESIAICPVPEARQVKNRVHLDVYASSVESVERRGARMLVPAQTSGKGWSVMADPEGGEFCVFLREPLPSYRIHGIAVDCLDPQSTARWWGEAFGVPVEHNRDDDGDEWWTLAGFTPADLTMDFNAVPEPKSAKNRLHWDVYGDVEALLDRGARVLWEVPGRTRAVAWTAMADPEGNEFCVFPRGDAA